MDCISRGPCEQHFCDSVTYWEVETLQNSRQKKPSAVDHPHSKIPFCFQEFIPSDAALPGWAGGPTGAPTAAGSMKQRQQSAHSVEVLVFGYVALLLTTCMRCCMWILLAQLFPTLVSQRDVSKPKCHFFQKKNITVNHSNEAHSFPPPHLLLPSYQRDKSPFIIQGLISPACSTAPQSWKFTRDERTAPFLHLSPCKQLLVF